MRQRSHVLLGVLVGLGAVACSSSGGTTDGGVGADAPAGDVAEGLDATALPDVVRRIGDGGAIVPRDAGPPPPCQETCDCPQGLACLGGECKTAGVGPVYCCANAGCPLGEACLGPGERPSRCPSPPDAGPDGGPRDIGAGAIGAGCEVDTECNQAQGLSCWEQFDAPFLWGGYCTLEDCLPTCPGGSTCINFTGGVNPVQGCMATCTADGDCRDDAYCFQVPASPLRICFPDCRDDVIDCAPRNGTQYCSRTSGRCEPSVMQSPGVPVGAACADNRDCGNGQVCLSQVAWGMVGGLCTRVCSGLPEATACGAGETCSMFGGVGFCFDNCTGGACPDRAGATCTSLDPTWSQPGCVPL
jgi:hypothetical protein